MGDIRNGIRLFSLEIVNMIEALALVLAAIIGVFVYAWINDIFNGPGYH